MPLSPEEIDVLARDVVRNFKGDEFWILESDAVADVAAFGRSLINKVGVQVNQNDVLETLLIQLAAMKDAAQAMAAAEYPPDAVWDWDGDNYIWFALEQSRDLTDHWTAGWLMKPGETSEFVIEVDGRTPIEAALALRTTMIEAR